MRTLLRCAFLTFLVAVQMDVVASHGRMIEPAARNAMWRYGYKNPKNYNDMGLNCGGFTNQFEQQFGRCGACGDPYQGQRDHEAGGRYARGLVARQYQPGTYINVTVELTSNHMGYFEFRLCPVNDPRKRASKACLDRHQLNIVGHGRRYFISQRDTSIYVQMFVQLPPNLRCSQCVMQWKWVAGQSMGPDGYGGECLGCGNQEHFVNCADIAIGSAPVAPLPPPAGGFKEPDPVAPPSAPKKVIAHAYAAPMPNSVPNMMPNTMPNAMPNPAMVAQAMAQAAQSGPPYQVNSPVASPGSGPPVFDGTMASILAQVFQMASNANHIKPGQAAAPSAPQQQPPIPNPAPQQRPPISNPTPQQRPRMPNPAPPQPQPQPQPSVPVTQQPPTWNPPPRAQALQYTNQNPVIQNTQNWNPEPAPAKPVPQVWPPATEQTPTWNPPQTTKAQAWNTVTANPVVNNFMSPYASASWPGQQQWQQPQQQLQQNSWVPQSNPIPSPPILQAVPSVRNPPPPAWTPPQPTPPANQNSKYDLADYAGNEPGEYPEAGEMPPPGVHVPSHTNNVNTGSGYMQGFNDAVNQLKQNLGLSTGNNGYSQKINTALSEVSVAMQEQRKPSLGGADASVPSCPGGTPRECRAGGAFAGNSDFDSWCMVSCNGGDCPANMCSCTCVGGAGMWSGGAGCRAVDRTKGASMDTWCVTNCKQNHCPSDLCVCGFSS